jgi:hypothetical protein
MPFSTIFVFTGNTIKHIKTVLATQSVQTFTGGYHQRRTERGGYACAVANRGGEVGLFSGAGIDSRRHLYRSLSVDSPDERPGRAAEE